jgi:hypothetical protein
MKTQANLPQPYETTAPRANISRLFFFRENYRPTAAF